MKGGTVQISWHGSDPVLSVDFHLPTGLLATAGADRDIKLWSLDRKDGSNALPSVTFKSNLSYHGAAVNVLRFSPSGELLASGGDNGELLIWRITQTEEEIPSWKVWKTLRFHHKDVLDLGWSPDGAFLVSGSVDNTSIIWNVEKGIAEQVLADHQHYVQGVSWDPAGKYVASLSGDRTCRIYSLRSPTKRSKAKVNVNGKYTCQHVLCKKDSSAAVATSAATIDGEESLQKQVPCPKQYLFYDENMPSFFRRLSWSPEGSFLLIPAGIEKESPDSAALSVSYIVSRNDLSRPAIEIPASGKPVVAARFCPVIYSLSPNKTWKHDSSLPGVGAFKLPYRLIFAVATLNSVFIYDTDQSCPIGVFAGVHYAPITDLAWSFDARFLAVSSQDGYCTLVGFDEGDLGTPLPLADVTSLSRACVQEDSSVVSPEKDSLGYPGDQLHAEMSVPGKGAAIGMHSNPRLSTGKALKRQSDGQAKPSKSRRINVKPISEFLEKPSSSRPVSCKPSECSGGLDDGEGPATDVRGAQSNAEVPLLVSQGPEVQSDLAGCAGDRDKRLDGVDVAASLSGSGSAQASAFGCEGADETIRKTYPKPISECLETSSSSHPDLSRPTDCSGGLQDEACPSTDVREGQSNAEVPVLVSLGPGVQLDSAECRVDRDKSLDGVDIPASLSGSGYAQGNASAWESGDKETSEASTSSPTMKVTRPDVCRLTQTQKIDDNPRTDQQCVTEYALGPNTPHCEEHGHTLGGNKCLSEKPRDRYADIYVRPLKFRRISPKIMSDIEEPPILKPLHSETSLPVPSGLQELQPT